MLVTINDAYAVAKQLKEKNPLIQDVELYGSVLKNGKGHDLDFILTVDDDTARKFWLQKDDTRFKWPPNLVFTRRILKTLFPWLDKALTQKKILSRNLRASVLLKIDLVLFGENYRAGTVIDVWLLPVDWRVGQSLNASSLSRITDISDAGNTLLFLEKMASVAKKVA